MDILAFTSHRMSVILSFTACSFLDVDVVLQKDRCGLACENKKHRRLPWETRDDVIAVPP
jgi:hypothetical protein